MIFEVKNGCFGYQKAEILKNVSFHVSSGEVLAILGSNGVGKTTLLRCMMGLLPWKRGSSCIDGIDISQMKPSLLWQRISYVPQAKGSTYGYSALEMVLLGRSSHLSTLAQPGKEDVEIAVQAMEEVGILCMKDKICNKMSGGELQMVLIARALAAQPEMLVLDEPESNLDFKNQLIILDTVTRLAKEKNISAVINTHYPAHALRVSDQALILNRDGVNYYGGTKEVINETNMERSFGVQVAIHDFVNQGKWYNTVVPLGIVT